eukprot:TRINITY_DN185_c0_g1_i2.p1 TRINITY_DN185_c0_g1~~TRINITY_DN185_c0_g1_i2.p1  ORF type:complete len:406 (+),score=53.31 TRINITY_DN185_c0_g1_i2:242-1459(+)
MKNKYNVDTEWVESPTAITELVQKIIENGKETFFTICDLGRVVSQARRWKRLLPRVQPYYAVKSNPDINILRTLFLLGVNFDCASKGEIDLVMSLGAEPTQIIYANPAKGIDHIEHAKAKDVRLMTFDNANELEKIMKNFPEAEVVLRIASNDSMSLLPFGFKFGASHNDALSLIHLSKQLNAKLVGISFHVGSGCYSPLAFVDTLRRAKELFNVAAGVGIDMTLLDIGGGFPGDDEGKITFDEIAAAVAPTLDSLFPSDIQIIAEPGRYFCGACMTEALQVYAKRDYIARRMTESNEITEIKEVQYYVPDGVYGSFNNIIYDHAHPVCKPLKEPPLDTVLYNTTIFGPTCDSIDVLAKNVHFPPLEIGDWVYFPSMGAYTVAAGSTFNGFSRPHIYYKILNHSN